ncbi:MAG: DAK2 domain-containing protein [Peptococcaceae bacterium]|nr:DAK2 domain-containing protein [Peptococcaceae bacterium]
MTIYSIDGLQLQEALVAGAARLARMRKEIDALNVFPVPDGDTGTNMYLTLIAALQEMGKISDESVGSVAEAAARGSLSGARGNSGVILSQLLQGFALALAGKKEATTVDLAQAYAEGARLAQKAVSEPVEGTILTVARAAGEAACYVAKRTCDIRRLSVYVYRRALEILLQTPEMLPVLKSAGVVDAGGKGYVVIMEGILHTFSRYKREQILLEPMDFSSSAEEAPPSTPAADHHSDFSYIYCTECVVKNVTGRHDEIRRQLTDLGDCLMVVGSGDTAKVHIHSNHPGKVLETCLQFGTLHNINISNMQDQHHDLQHRSQEKAVGVVAVAIGEGMVEIFRSLGADEIVNGGQTMNPSTDEIARAVGRVPAETVFVLPNNKNIVLAAQQANKLITNKNIIVIPTTSIPQGLAALLSFDPENDIDTNTKKMQEAAQNILTGEVTQAVRDAVYNDTVIRTGEYIGLAEDTLVKGTSIFDTVTQVVSTLLESSGELVTLYYGNQLTSEEAQEIVDQLNVKYPNIEFELYYGGQPLYDFIISVE